MNHETHTTKTRHVVISGGASGLGLGMALRYLKRGDCVSVLDLCLSEEARKQLEIAAAVGSAQWCFQEADVTDDQIMSDAMRKAQKQFGNVSLAINSAGIPLCKTIADMRPDEFNHVINVNLIGSYNFAATVVPHLEQGGHLALVASLAGITSNYGYSAYGSSKFGVLGLATTLRYEYELQGFKVSCICPPEVFTPLVEAERLHANPIAMELKKIAGTMHVVDACDEIVEGLDQQRWLIIPSINGKLTAWVARYTPGLFHSFLSYMIRRTSNRIKNAPQSG